MATTYTIPTLTLCGDAVGETRTGSPNPPEAGSSSQVKKQAQSIGGVGFSL